MWVAVSVSGPILPPIFPLCLGWTCAAMPRPNYHSRPPTRNRDFRAIAIAAPTGFLNVRWPIPHPRSHWDSQPGSLRPATHNAGESTGNPCSGFDRARDPLGEWPNWCYPSVTLRALSPIRTTRLATPVSNSIGTRICSAWPIPNWNI